MRQSVRVRGRFKDRPRLALKMEEETEENPGMQEISKSWTRQENIIPWDL